MTWLIIIICYYSGKRMKDWFLMLLYRFGLTNGTMTFTHHRIHITFSSNSLRISSICVGINSIFVSITLRCSAAPDLNIFGRGVIKGFLEHDTASWRFLGMPLISLMQTFNSISWSRRGLTRWKNGTELIATHRKLTGILYDSGYSRKSSSPISWTSR